MQNRLVKRNWIPYYFNASRLIW